MGYSPTSKVQASLDCIEFYIESDNCLFALHFAHRCLCMLVVSLLCMSLSVYVFVSIFNFWRTLSLSFIAQFCAVFSNDRCHCFNGHSIVIMVLGEVWTWETICVCMCVWVCVCVLVSLWACRCARLCTYVLSYIKNWHTAIRILGWHILLNRINLYLIIFIFLYNVLFILLFFESLYSPKGKAFKVRECRQYEKVRECKKIQ
jgi:hypothetical protein